VTLRRAWWLAAATLFLACGDDETAAPTSTSSGGAGGTSPDCAAQCDLDHPGGVDLYQALQGCVFCGACYDHCEAERPLGDPSAMLCAMENELGCSASTPDCDTCVAGNAGILCWSGRDPDTSEEIDPMAPCNAQYDSCQASPDCVALSDCYRAC
jgi:hypothetical protein